MRAALAAAPARLAETENTDVDPMKDCKQAYADPERLVGDPVDVVTGAVIDINFEFKLPGPIPFLWRRYYDSSKADKRYALGWGHSHEYERLLHYDLDGMHYAGPAGKVISFLPLLKDGDQTAASGLHLRRLSAQNYQVRDSEGIVMTFVFRDFTSPALLQTLAKGDDKLQFGYDSKGLLHSVIDAQDRLIQIDNDDQGRITGLLFVGTDTIKERSLMQFRYDAAGNLSAGIDTYGHGFSFEFDEQHRLITRCDRRGYKFHYEYDTNGRCTHSYGEDGLHEVKLRYLLMERATVVTRADGGQWTYIYDAAGVITKIIDPYGGVRTFAVNEQGQVEQETDPNGNVTVWVYGSYGERAGKFSALGWFADDGDIPARPDQATHRVPGSPLQWEYGDLLADEDSELPAADSRVLQSMPSAMRKAIRTALVDTAKPGASRDAMGLLVKETDYKGTARQWLYDAGGNTVRFRDRDGSTYDYEYGSWDLCLRELNPLGHAVTYRYSKTGKMTQIKDPGGAFSEYIYDHKDRLIELRRHGVSKEQYRYDDADNLIEKLDGEGNTLFSCIIGEHNLTAERHLASGEIHRFTYTGRGFYAAVAAAEHEVVFDYDNYKNRVQDERDGLGVRCEFSGPRELRSSTVFGRFTTRYSRDENGSLLITDPAGGEHSIVFLGHGLIQRHLSGGSAELSQYDPDGRCLSKAVTCSRRPGTVWTRAFTYSGEGDLLQVDDNNGDSISYEYDCAHRLKRALHKSGKVQTFAYDSAGNLLQQPGLDGVTLYDGNRLKTANGDQFEYDQRQNIALRQGDSGKTRYHYNAHDMLVKCEMAHGTLEAVYDPLGRRIKKDFGGRSVEFYWDSDRLAAEVRSEGYVRIYIYADAFAITPFMFIEYAGIDAEPESGRRYFIFTNHLATPVRVEDEQGQIVWQAELDPYGRVGITGTASIEMPLRFPGHYCDSETGLHYNRFRYYSPELGRYLQSDPLDINGGVNLYAYTDNPLKQVDVRGDCPKTKKPGQDADATEGGEEALAKGVKGILDKIDNDRRAKPTLEELQRHVWAGKTYTDMEVFARSKFGEYFGYCGASARNLLPALGEDGLGGALGIHAPGLHTIVAGKTDEGKYYIFDPTVEQFTPEGANIAVDDNYQLRRDDNGDYVRHTNDEIIKAAQGQSTKPEAAFIKDVHDNNGLATFDDRESMEKAMDWYGEEVNRNILGKPRNWEELPRDEWDPDRFDPESLNWDDSGAGQKPLNPEEFSDDGSDFDDEPTLVDIKPPGSG